MRKYPNSLHRLFIMKIVYEYRNAKVGTDLYRNEFTSLNTLYVICICISNKQPDGEAAAIKNFTLKMLY